MALTMKWYANVVIACCLVGCVRSQQEVDQLYREWMTATHRLEDKVDRLAQDAAKGSEDAEQIGNRVVVACDAEMTEVLNDLTELTKARLESKEPRSYALDRDREAWSRSMREATWQRAVKVVDHYRANHSNTVVRRFRPAIGEAAAYLEMGRIRAEGRGLSVDYSKAKEFFEESAKRGSAEACYELGCLYEAGHGVDANLSEARKQYARSATQFYPEGLIASGRFWMFGIGGPADAIMAIQYFEQAAIQGSVSGMMSLALMYEEGRGVPVNPSLAYRWYDAAVLSGNAIAIKARDHAGQNLSEQQRAQEHLHAESWLNGREPTNFKP